MPVTKKLNWMTKIDDETKISNIAIPGRMSFQKICGFPGKPFH